ncbi:MAG: tetratricopeptide repeat protein [Ignavibacteria bacterium]
MKKLIPVFFFLFLITNLFAQKQGIELIDSLKSKLESAIEDTSKVRLLGQLSFQYYKYDTDLGIYYGGRALSLAENLRWVPGIAFSCNYIGTNYAVKGNFPKALEYFSKSLSKYTEIGDKHGIAMLSNNLGNFYRILKEFYKAIEFFNKAVAINKGLNDKLELVRNYNNLGSAYGDLYDMQKSDDYYYKALNITREINSKELAARILINIADNKTRVKDYCEAIKLGIQAVKISDELNITYDRAEYNGYVGLIYLNISNDSSASADNCQYYSNNKRENLLFAKKYLYNSVKLLERIHDLILLSENFRILSQVYEKLGDNKNALDCYKKYSAFKDSVFSKDNSIKIANIEKKQEVELRDKQIKIQSLEIDKKSAQIFHQIIFFILLVLLTLFLSYLYYKKKSDKVLSESEEKFRNLYDNAPAGLYRTTPDGRILLANKSLVNMLGYPSFEKLSERNLEQDGFDSSYPRRYFIEEIEKNGELKGLESQWNCYDGSFIMVKEHAKVIRDINGNTLYFDGMVEDITMRKLAEEKIKISLKEKEVLLREIHHRVKNNMYIISSLLDLQVDLLTDKKMTEVFQASQNRIQALALVHELMYKSPDFTSIDIKNYIINLAEHLRHSYIEKKEQIEFSFDIDNIALNIDIIIPVGLIVNEVVSNSLKHAFPNERKGRVSISMKADSDNNCTLSFSDNGIGLPPEINAEDQNTLGLFLILNLSQQINGELKTSGSDNGTEHKIIFHLDKDTLAT